MAAAAREAGNAAFRQRDFAAAVARYSESLAAERSAAVLSNRSAAHAGLSAWDAALADADGAAALEPSWPKAQRRRGAALTGLGRDAEATEAYAAGEAASAPGSAAAAEFVALRQESRRRAELLSDAPGGGGRRLVCDARATDAELEAMCASLPRGALVELDAADALCVSVSGIAAALRAGGHRDSLRSLTYAFVDLPSPKDAPMLRRTAPNAAIKCVTENFFDSSLLHKPSAAIIRERVVVPMLARSDSAAVAVAGSMALGAAAYLNSFPAGEAGGAEAVVAALRSARALDLPPAERKRVVSALAGGLQNIVAGCAPNGARAAAAGAPEALLAVLQPHLDDVHVAQDIFGVLNSMACEESIKRSLDAGVVPLLYDALARHGGHAECVPRLLSQVMLLAGHSAAARIALGEAGLVELVLPLRAGVSSEAGWAERALSALCAACPANEARAAAAAAGGGTAALGPASASVREANAAYSRGDLGGMERAAGAARAALGALPPATRASPAAAALGAQAAFLWAIAAGSLRGDEAAEAACDAIHEALKASHLPGAPARDVLLQGLGEALSRARRPAEAEAALRECIALRRQTGAARLGIARAALAQLCSKQHREAEAAALFSAALEDITLSETDRRMVQAAAANTAEQRGRHAAAARLRASMRMEAPDECVVCLLPMSPCRPTAPDGEPADADDAIEVLQCGHMLHRCVPLSWLSRPVCAC